MRDNNDPDTLMTTGEAWRYLETTRFILMGFVLRKELASQVTARGTFLFRRGDLDAIRDQVAERSTSKRSSKYA